MGLECDLNDSRELRVKYSFAVETLRKMEDILNIQSGAIFDDSIDIIYGGKVKATEFVNNGILHMFEEIRYELNGVEIDRCKNVGITTLLKGWPSCERGNGHYNENTDWIADLSSIKFVDDENRFYVIIAMIFGFNENYRKIIVNMKHELAFIISRNNVNAVVQTGLTAAAAADTAATYEDF